MAVVQLFDGYDADQFQENDLVGSTGVELDSHNQTLSWGGGEFFMSLTGAGLTYGGSTGAVLTGGIVTDFTLAASYGRVEITGAHADAATLGLAFDEGDDTLGASTLLAGDDIIVEFPKTSMGTPNADQVYLVRGWGGNDQMVGGGTQSTFFGGDGDDTLQAVAGDGNYLRGDAGDDIIFGADGFDDINGNMGNDTASGQAGDDWVVGGKDHDLLFGDAGGDVVLGNLGNDTVNGGDGNDQVRGGQGDDLVNGDAGDDFISGDRGNDTITGGAGADVFHGSQDARLDLVLDFHVSEGDRVMLDPGVHFNLIQVGADTVLDMGGGNQMVLVGVPMSSLTAGSIFFG